MQRGQLLILLNRLIEQSQGRGYSHLYDYGPKYRGQEVQKNVVLRDSIPNGTTFVAGSVTVGGVTQPNANPANGINLGTIQNNTQRIVTFQVRE